jgi:release factor glutamine methyltransferase
VITIAQYRAMLATELRAAGIDTPDLDARLLMEHALGLDHAALTAASDRAVGPGHHQSVQVLASRRLAREPMAQILGRKEFWSLDFLVTPAVLVPRPETETVVEAALDAVDASGPRIRTLRFADLGTGSGALLLALLSELPNATGVGTDVSAGALHVARNNADRLGFHPRAQFALCDFGTALAGGFDLIVCNPPYVASGDIPSLSPEVKHDPHRSLDGGPDGLAAYRMIAADAGRLLAPEGHLVVELGAGQEQPVAAMFSRQGLAVAPARHDLAGIPRALTLWRR